MTRSITYKEGNDIDLDTFIDLYHASTLGERRPIGDRERMAGMLENTNLLITAWEGDLLVGVARAVTDFTYCAYLSDLAVRVSHQRMGIGKELIRQTQARLHAEGKIILLAAPKAVDYYPGIGFRQHNSAWVIGARDEVG